MLPSELLQTITETVISYALNRSLAGIEERVRIKLGLAPTQQAFKHALKTSIEKFDQSYPQWTASLFDADFLKKEGAPILAQFLVRDGHPDPSKLAALWADSLNIRQPERRTILTRELEPAAADFLDYLAQALKDELALSEVNDSRVLEQLAADLAALRVKFGAEKATPGTRRDYLHWMMERYLYLDARGTLQTQRQVQLELTAVYIWLRARHDDMPDVVDQHLEEAEPDFLTSGIGNQAEQGSIEHGGGGLKTNGDKQDEILDLFEVVKNNDRLVILGEPGSGKTTLLRYLALKHAQALWRGQFEASTELGPVRFPIRIRIADYAERGIPKGTSLSDFLAEYCITRECPRTGLADLIATELAGGNCLILIDGLDEIVSADVRRRTVEQIEDFVRRHGASPNHFIITSRIPGYMSAPLSGSFAQYTIQGMNDAQIRCFLERWCNTVEDAQTPLISEETRRRNAKHQVEGILSAINASPGVRRLAANPLLLRILALIHHTGAQLPQKRIELYKLAADTLARTWRPAQGVPELALVKDEYLTPLLGKLAYWLHVHKATGLAGEQEVKEVLGAEWADLNDLSWNANRPNPSIMSKVNEFLKVVREQTGIFIERAPRRYGFMHLTFEEYYAARYLVASSETRAQLIRRHLHDHRWEEPILLALGFVGLDYSKDAAKLLEITILAEGEDAEKSGLTPSPCENLLGRDYLFALRCLGDGIPARPVLVQRLTKQLANEILSQAGSARFQRYRLAVEEGLKHLKGSEGALELLPLLVAALKDLNPNARVRLRAVQSIGQLEQNSSEAMESLLKALHDRDLNVRNAAARSLRQLGQIPGKVITALLSSLGDRDPHTRGWAAESLGQLGPVPDEVVTALLKTLHDDSEPGARRAAAESLGQLGPVPDEVVTALLDTLQNDSEELGVRRAAAGSLGQLGPASDKVIAALLGSLNSDDSGLRFKAVQSLGQLNSATEVVTALLKTLHDDSEPGVRRVAAQDLGLLERGQATNEVVTALLSALHDDPEPWVRGSAVESLAQLGRVSKEVVTSLLDARNDGNFSVRRVALQSLKQMIQAPGEAVSILLGTLCNSDSNVRRTSAEGLGLLEQGQASDDVVNALLKTLHDDLDYSVRREAVESLGQLGKESPEVLTALIEALKDPKSAAVRAAAAESFEKSSLTPEVRGLLTKALYDISPEVCYQAAISLGRLALAHGTPDQAVSDIDPDIEAILFRALLSAESWTVRRDAALLLGQLGQSTSSTALLHGLQDIHSLVCTACAQALAQLGQRYPKTAKEIEKKLVQVIKGPEVVNESFRDYAFDSLWLLVGGGEIEARR